MPTLALTIEVPDRYQEFLVAELADLDFEAFEMEDDCVVAYIPSARWDDVRREQIETWLRAHDVSSALSERFVDDENWNQKWEETVGPVVVEPFLVKPTWREAPTDIGELTLLEIDPKMSFGTGYHASTRLLLRLLPDHIAPGARVLDAGTGTGILAIAAAKIGAEHVDAFDIDPWSQRNALENVYLNDVATTVSIIDGSIEAVPKTTYDVVLANINLNVICGLLPEFGIRLRRGGRLLVSGVLGQDRRRLLDAAARHGFEPVADRREDEWLASVFSYGGI